MNEVKYAWVSLLHRRGELAIKVTSVALGLGVAILLLARVAFNLSYDRVYADADRLHQLWFTYVSLGGGLNSTTPGRIAEGIREEMGDVVESATIVSSMWSDPLNVGKAMFDDPVVVADSMFFETMGLKVLQGIPRKDMQQRDVVYLSERLARKMFGSDDAIGRTVMYDNQIELTVKGIYSTLPENVSVVHDAVISLPTMTSRWGGMLQWSSNNIWKTLVKVRDASMSTEELDERLVRMYEARTTQEEDSRTTVSSSRLDEVISNSDNVKRMNLIMTVLAVALLMVTALNYSLLTIASLSRRAKAIGVHKCSGAGGGTIFGMFMWETAMVIGMSLVVAAGLTWLFREPIESTLEVSTGALLGGGRLMTAVAVVAVFFVIGGVLPARMFSRVPVTQVFRRFTERNSAWKRVLLAVQFAGVAFIGGLLAMVWLQYNEVTGHDLGYNPSGLAVGRTPVKSFEETGPSDAAYAFFKSQPYVESVTNSVSYPTTYFSGCPITGTDGKIRFSAFYSTVNPNYVEAMGMQMVAGEQRLKPDEIVVNEEFVRQMGWTDNPIGKKVNTAFFGERTVAGVVKNYVARDLTDEMIAVMMLPSNLMAGYVQVRLKEPYAENLLKLEADTQEAFPDSNAQWHMLTQLIADQYTDTRTFHHATMIAAIAIVFITLMGLVGYIRDEIQRRSKEIAIRKVNGAEASGIVELIGSDVMKTAVPSVVAGVACAWWTGSMWLEQFKVTADYITGYYILIGVVTLVLIAACVTGLTWHTACENPVVSLKSE